MATRDLDRLAKRVKAHRLELYPSRLAAARAAGISKDTWRKVEEAHEDVRDSTYAKVAMALGWTSESCIGVAEGGEPVLADSPAGGAPAVAAPGSLAAEDVRRAAFEAARSKLPTAPIGDIDAFSDELVEILRRAGSVTDGS